MSSHLEKLPPELLDSIFDNFGGPRNVALSAGEDWLSRGGPGWYCPRESVCHALCLSSKKLCEVATPHLYRIVMFSDSEPKIRQLARTLCERPEYVKHVHALCASSSMAKPYDQPTPEELALFVRQIEPLRTQAWCPMLVSALWSGCYTAELLVLLTLCTDLRRLDLETHDGLCLTREPDRVCNACQDLPSRLLDIYTSGCPRWSLSKLTCATLSGKHNAEGQPGSPHTSLSPFFCSPKLEHLTCDIFTSVASAYTWACPPSSSNIQSLSLSRGNLETGDIVQILDSCKALRNCQIQWGAYKEGGYLRDYRCDVDTQALLAALGRHSPTLECLDLTNNDHQWLDLECQSPLVTLQHFRKLRVLRIDECFFFRDGEWTPDTLRDKLPPALIKLSIHLTYTNLNELGGVLMAVNACDGIDLDDLRITIDVSVTDGDAQFEYLEHHDEVTSMDAPAWSLHWSWNDDILHPRFVFRCCMRPMRALLSELAKAATGDSGGVALVQMMEDRIRDAEDMEWNSEGEEEEDGEEEEKEEEEDWERSEGEGPGVGFLESLAVQTG